LNRRERVALQKRLNDIINGINNDKDSDGMNRCFGVGGNTWTWLNFNGNLINDAVTGVIISLSFAFIVILLTTQNIIVTVISVFCIASIIIQMMSMIQIMGWQFGTIESICVIVLVGIAFDYVSHFAHLYMISPFENKKERVDYAYQHMGQTILGGALTSNLTGVFMMIC